MKRSQVADDEHENTRSRGPNALLRNDHQKVQELL